jgi:acyl carrier protein
MEAAAARESTRQAESLYREVLAAIGGVLSDWEPEDIALESRLGADLGMSSIELVRLAGALQRRLGGGPIPFQELFVAEDGAIVQDIRVSRLVDFLAAHGAKEN